MTNNGLFYFSILEAKEEYISRFLEGNIGKVTWLSANNSRPLLTDLSQSDDGPLSPEQINKLPPLDVTPDEAAQLGYMPLRDDFDKVCSYDALRS